MKFEDLEVRTTLNDNEKIVMGAVNHCATYVCKDGPKTVANVSYTTCHSQIRSSAPRNISEFSGAYLFQKEGAKELFMYLISEDGPFKDLRIFDGVYLFGNTKDNPQGFTIPDHVWQGDYVYPLMYAFLINTRIPHEREAHAQSFAYMTAGGHDKNLMFIISKYLAIKNGSLNVSGDAWNGGHNVFAENDIVAYQPSPKYIDVRMYCNGEYHKGLATNAYTSDLWKIAEPKKESRTMASFMWAAYSEKIKTRFTTIDRIPSEQEIKMIEDFKKFIDMRY